MRVIRKAIFLAVLLGLGFGNLVHAQTPSPYIYDDQLRNTFQNTSWSNSGSNPVNVGVTNPVFTGAKSISLTATSVNSVLRFSASTPVDVSPYLYLTFSARAASTGGNYFVTIDGNNTRVELANYGGQPPVNSWRTYNIPLSALNMAYSQVGEIIFAHDTFWSSTHPTIYLDEIKFTGTAPTPTPSPTPAPMNATLSVDATVNINPFDKKMLGMALVNWEHSWGRPYPNSVPGLAQAMKAIHVGMIRYAGGLWANWVGWDRVVQRTPYTDWTKNGNTYSFHYGTDEVDNLAAFASNIGADVLVQVNVSNNDPAMWADMVKYTNVDHNYKFKYWELGNELDHECANGATTCLTTAVYQQRVQAYSQAMKAVDPTIIIVGGVPASGHDFYRTQDYSGATTAMSTYLSAAKAGGAGALSYHWYQGCNIINKDDILTYTFSSPYTAWQNAYARIWSKIAPERVQNEIIQNSGLTQGITELNADACDFDLAPQESNHLNAIWTADVLGRLAYNGLDFATWYTGFGTPQQGYPLIYKEPDQDQPSSVKLRPTYYAYYMLANYFGNQMVKTTTSDEQNISVWSAKDSQNSNKLAVMVTNMSASTITAPISVTGFTPVRGEVYVMKSTNPTDMTNASNTDHATTTINNGVLDPMNVTASAGTNILPINLNVTSGNFTYVFPPYSVTSIILYNSGTSVPVPDTNSDGKVNVLDVGKVLLSIGWTGANGGNIADINSDGKVDVLDIKAVLTAWH